MKDTNVQNILSKDICCPGPMNEKAYLLIKEKAIKILFDFSEPIKQVFSF